MTQSVEPSRSLACLFESRAGNVFRAKEWHALCWGEGCECPGHKPAARRPDPRNGR